MSVETAMTLLEKGKQALSNNEEQSALEYLEQAFQQERSPEICSFYAYCLAKHKSNYNDAIPLAQEAIEGDSSNPQIYLNYGRILYMAGDKEQAAETFRNGLEHGMHFDFIRELESVGTRGPAVFKKLDRKHFLNRAVGRFLAILNLR